MNGEIEHQEQENELKLGMLRRLAKDAFDEIDRGEFEIVDVEGIDKFMDKLDAKVRSSKTK